ncbi:3'(2'),5'-bisphosphate nucleotidase CysQ [Vampirovibrio sp.]|uniref:3'(2'),5'-bisphosphate nucleotidase CysQ n=1 Tax=Vampirovibrio sp. TaxID=2717857 RepID=UPI003593124A
MTQTLQLDTTSLQAVIAIARQAGQAIMAVYEGGFELEYKSDNSPLTTADQRSHDIIEAGLSALFPSLPILSEESKQVPYEIRKNWECFWLVDPLDGTKEFIKRNGEFTVNIALISSGRAIAGVVYLPAQDILYFAVEGEGSYKMDQSGTTKLPLINRSNQDRLTVIGSRSHHSDAMEAFITRQKQSYQHVHLQPAGSSLKFCLVAEGTVDLYPRLAPTMEWDTAAAHVIARESGKSVIHYETGQELVYNKENLQNPWFICGDKGFWSPKYE